MKIAFDRLDIAYFDDMTSCSLGSYKFYGIYGKS